VTVAVPRSMRRSSCVSSLLPPHARIATLSSPVWSHKPATRNPFQSFKRILGYFSPGSAPLQNTAKGIFNEHARIGSWSSQILWDCCSAQGKISLRRRHEPSVPRSRIHTCIPRTGLFANLNVHILYLSFFLTRSSSLCKPPSAPSYRRRAR
jgi:hypothetical protein